MKKLSKGAKKQILNILFLLLLIGITLTVLITCSDLNYADIKQFINGCNPWLLVTAALCMIAGIVCEGLSLHLISRKFGHKGRLVSSIAYSSADIYYSAITPSATGGQPASAYYMIKDGMGAGTASFTLLLNAIAYTAALIILGVVTFAIRPHMFVQFDFWVKFFIILGMVIQVVLLGFFIACMFCHRAVLKVGNGLISLLVKMKFVKNPDKWRNKLAEEVGKYRNCVHEIKKHWRMFIGALLLNIAQRVVRVLISCFVFLAYDKNAPFWDIFALQSYVTVGYTFLPLPGGVGAFEALYVGSFTVIYAKSLVQSAMMVVRTIQYYLSIIVSGAVTLSYHVYIMRRKSPVPQAVPSVQDGGGETATEENTEALTQENSEEAIPAETVEEQPAKQPSADGEITEEEREGNEEHL